MKLMSRYWQITDANGDVQEVVGDGVVGQQPVIEPGEGFGIQVVLISTPVGTMQGKYKMVAEDGHHLTQKFRFFIFRFREPTLIFKL